MKKSQNILIGLIFVLILFNAKSSSGNILFQEDFQDNNFGIRGWYDSPSGTINASEHISGSTGSFECHWTQGSSACAGGQPQRHKFTPTDSVYVSFWLKHSTTWIGQGSHIFYLLTTEDGDYAALASDHLDAYINDSTGKPFKIDLELQDALNIDASKLNVDLTQITETRASQGCNGLLDNTADYVSCYSFGGNKNMRLWESPIAFTTSPGLYYMSDWHHVEAYFKLSGIDPNGKGMTNGILQLWLDGQLLINLSNVNFRTGIHPTMLFNQLVLSPYMGVSPADQSIWIDSLTVATSQPLTNTSIPSPPQLLQVK